MQPMQSKSVDVVGVINIALASVYGALGNMVDASDFIDGIYVCIHTPYKPMKHFACVAYMPNLVRVFVCGTDLVVTHEVDIQVVVFCHTCAKMSGLYAHIVCWLYGLHLQCGSSNCSVINGKYLYSACCPHHIIHASYIIWHIFVYTYPIHLVKYIAYRYNLVSIFVPDTFGKNVWSRYCSLLLGIYMQKCWVYIAILHDGSFIWIFNVVDILANWYMLIIWSEVCELCIGSMSHGLL